MQGCKRKRMMKTILIVDDEPAARYGLRRALEANIGSRRRNSAEAAREALPASSRTWYCWTSCCLARMGYRFCAGCASREAKCRC